VDLDEVVTELTPRVLRYLRARLGDASVAEDVAQESLAALVRACRHGAAPESPDAFVFAIARRRAGRVLWRRRLWAPLDSASGAEASGPSPESSTIARAEERRVRAALARLGRRDREAILLVAVGGLRMADAAHTLDISVSAIKMRVSRARARLTTLLEEHHDTRRTA
jgi:RNA polymerase sigma-70 factor (ECF subfamily)